MPRRRPHIGNTLTDGAQDRKLSKSKSQNQFLKPHCHAALRGNIRETKLYAEYMKHLEIKYNRFKWRKRKQSIYLLNDFMREQIECKNTLTHAGPGVFEQLPQVFRRYLKKKKNGGAGHRCSGTHVHNLFWTLCENFRPRSIKVMYPDHVKWPHLRKSLNARHSYTEWQITLKRPAIDIVTVSMKRMSRNLDIGDLRPGQFWGLSILSQW